MSNEIRSLNDGDVSVFNAIYNSYFKAVYANVYKIVKSPEFTEEIVQDVFVTLWQNRSKLHPEKPVAGWLFRVSFNKSITFLKQKVGYSIDYVESYDASLLDRTEEEPDAGMLESKLEAVEKTIQLLSPRQREILTLCKIEGKSKEEVASLLGISPETVKEHLKQSYRMIKSRIGQNLPNGIIEMVLIFTLQLITII